MASQWYSLVSQKLYLAKVLLEQAQAAPSAGSHPTSAVQESLNQATVEMLLRAKQALLAMIAGCYQQKAARPGSLAELKGLLAYEVPEVSELELLAASDGNWWSHLQELERLLSEPAAPKKHTSTENVIAVSADNTPDRSLPALEQTRAAMMAFARRLEEQHSEW